MYLPCISQVTILAIELSLGLDPSACCGPPWRGPARRHAAPTRRWPAVPPWLGRLGLRTLFLASQVFCAQLLLSGEGDTLLSLQSLTGSIGMVAFTYFLPYAFMLVLTPPDELSTPRTLWAALNIAFGVVVMLSGLGSSIAELAESSAGVFAGDCKLQWSFAPLSPDDPCNASGLPAAARATVLEPL